jgi:transposase
MEAWGRYVSSAGEHLPGVADNIVFGKFHTVQHLGQAGDQVWRKEHKTLTAAGDERLVGTRYEWLKNQANMDLQERSQFAEL